MSPATLPVKMVTVAHVFVSGNLALDLVGTLKWRTTAPEELLAVPEDLDAWCTQAGVTTEPVGATEGDLADARRLREALHSLARAHLDGREADAEAVDVVNTAAAREPVRPRLTPHGAVRTGSAPAALSTTARAAIDLLAAPEAPLLKECGRYECTRIYVDRSRGARRTWCGMDECGSRVKMAAYRARRRQTGLAGR